MPILSYQIVCLLVFIFCILPVGAQQGSEVPLVESAKQILQILLQLLQILNPLTTAEPTVNLEPLPLRKDITPRYMIMNVQFHIRLRPGLITFCQVK